MRIAGLALTSLLVLGPGRLGARALASPAPDPKIQRADQLFAEGKALLDTNLLQACDKFDQSLRENPAAIGTLLNVALCDEKLGRVASAVDRFSEARDRAKEQGLREHQRAAEEHIAALTPAVPHLTIKLAEQLPDIKVLIDDRVVELDALASVAVDPGEREIVVSAPARLPYRAKLVVTRAEHKDVAIPALARSITVTSSRRRIGQISTAIGGAAIGAGVGLGLYARRIYNQQFDGELCQHTAGGELCSPAGQSRTERARTLGNVGTAVGVVGVVAAGVGVYLWVRSPDSSRADRPDKQGAHVTVVPSLASDHVGVAALGRF